MKLRSRGNNSKYTCYKRDGEAGNTVDEVDVREEDEWR